MPRLAPVPSTDESGLGGQHFSPRLLASELGEVFWATYWGGMEMEELEGGRRGGEAGQWRQLRWFCSEQHEWECLGLWARQVENCEFSREGV